MGTAAQREEVESKFTHKEVLNIYKLMIQNGLLQPLMRRALSTP